MSPDEEYLATATQAEKDHFQNDLELAMTAAALKMYRKIEEASKKKREEEQRESGAIAALTDQLKADNEAKQKEREDKDRAKGKRSAPIWGMTATEEDNESIRELTETGVPDICFERMESRQPFPISLLRPDLLKLYAKPEEKVAKTMRDHKQIYNLEEDFALAGKPTEHLYCLALFLKMVKKMVDLKKPGFTLEAYQMIAGHCTIVQNLLVEAKSDTTRLDILLYDVTRRRLLYNETAKDKNVNISGFHQTTYADAKNDRLSMYLDRDLFPNIYDHYTPSQSQLPPFTSASSTTSPQNSPSHNKRPRDDYHRYDNRYNDNRQSDRYPNSNSHYDRPRYRQEERYDSRRDYQRDDGYGRVDQRRRYDREGSSQSFRRCFGCGSSAHTANRCDQANVKLENGSIRASPIFFPWGSLAGTVLVETGEHTVIVTALVEAKSVLVETLTRWYCSRGGRRVEEIVQYL